MPFSVGERVFVYCYHKDGKVVVVDTIGKAITAPSSCGRLDAVIISGDDKFRYVVRVFTQIVRFEQFFTTIVGYDLQLFSNYIHQLKPIPYTELEEEINQVIEKERGHVQGG